MDVNKEAALTAATMVYAGILSALSVTFIRKAWVQHNNLYRRTHLG